jgi:hypothetical protein
MTTWCSRRRFGTPTDPRNALRAFVGIAVRAGLADVGLHTLRHSTASTLIAAGEHIKVVQQMLGHSSYAITADIYSHMDMQQQRGCGAARGGFPVVTSAVATPVATFNPNGGRSPGKKSALTRTFTVGLARFELATP